MRRITRGLVAAMESEAVAAAAATGQTTDPAAATQPTIVDHSDTVETGLMDIADSEAAAAQVDEQTDEAVEVATALESIAVCLKSAAGNGGMSRDGAQAVNIAVAHMCKRVGIDPVTRRLPALESYGSVSSRVTATTLAMESVADTAKKIWRAILDALKKSMDWLVERWQLFYGTAEKLKKRAEALVAEAGKIGAKEANPKELDKSALVAALHVAGKVDGAAIMAGFEHINKVAASVFGGVEKRMEALAKVPDAKDEAAAKALVVELSNQPDTTPVENPEAEGIRKPLDGMKVQRSAELPGGKAFICETAVKNPETVEDAVKAMGATKYYIGDFSSKSKPAEGVKLAVLNPADMGKLAGEVVKLADVIAKFQEGAKKVAEKKKELMGKVEEWAKKEEAAPAAAAAAPAAKPAEGGATAATEDETSGAAAAPADAAGVSKLARANVAAIGRLIDSPISGTSVYMLNTGKRALDYVTECLGAYGVKVEGGDKKEEAKPAEAKPAGDKPADGAAPAAA